MWKAEVLITMDIPDSPEQAELALVGLLAAVDSQVLGESAAVGKGLLAEIHITLTFHL